MNTLLNFIKYSLTKKRSNADYYRMRNDYVSNKRDIIGDTCNFNQFIRPKYRITSSTGALGMLSGQDAKMISRKLQEDGYYVFPKALDHAIVEKLVTFAKETPLQSIGIKKDSIHISEKPELYENLKNKAGRHEFMDIKVFQNSDEIMKLCMDETFLHVANEYLETKPILDLITIWWSNSLAEVQSDQREKLKSASAQMFHFDMDRLKFLKFFIYLTDVDTHNGPHVYVKGSHRRLPHYIKSDGRYADELVYKYDAGNVIEIGGKAGTIIAVDTRGLHKGKELEKGERLIFQLEFTNSLFGKPELPGIDKKFNYSGKREYFNSYLHFFKL